MATPHSPSCWTKKATQNILELVPPPDMKKFIEIPQTLMSKLSNKKNKKLKPVKKNKKNSTSIAKTLPNFYRFLNIKFAEN